jgi:hypothetical protein
MDDRRQRPRDEEYVESPVPNEPDGEEKERGEEALGDLLEHDEEETPVGSEETDEDQDEGDEEDEEDDEPGDEGLRRTA